MKIVSANGLTILRVTLGQNATLRGYVRCLEATVETRSVRLHEILLFVRDLLPALYTFQLVCRFLRNKPLLSNIARSLLVMGFPSVRRLVLLGVPYSRMSHLLRAFPSIEHLEFLLEDGEEYTGKICYPPRLSLTSLKVSVTATYKGKRSYG